MIYKCVTQVETLLPFFTLKDRFNHNFTFINPNPLLKFAQSLDHIIYNIKKLWYSCQNTYIYENIIEFKITTQTSFESPTQGLCMGFKLVPNVMKDTHTTSDSGTI